MIMTITRKDNHDHHEQGKSWARMMRIWVSSLHSLQQQQQDSVQKWRGRANAKPSYKLQCNARTSYTLQCNAKPSYTLQCKCKNFLHIAMYCRLQMQELPTHMRYRNAPTHQALHLLLHINKARMQSLSTKTCSIAPINATKTILCIWRCIA